MVFLNDVRGFAPQTIASYRSSLAAVIGSIDGVPLGHHPTLSRLLRSLTLARPRTRPQVPAWDLSRVLQFLASRPDPADWSNREANQFFTCKLAFLLALATGKRRSELQALSRDPRDLRLSPQGAWLRTVAGFLPKAALPGHDPAPFFVSTLSPEEASSSTDERLCPVQCLGLYIRLTGGLQEGHRLFRLIRGDGAPSSDTLARWIVWAIRSAHDDPTPGAHAHQVRRLAASWAYQGGRHSLEEVLAAGWWASQNTFTRLYLAHLHPQPDGRYHFTPVVAGRQIPIS